MLIFFCLFVHFPHRTHQNFAVQVTQKVFELCGTPRLGRRAALARTSQFVFEKRLEKAHRPPARPHKSDFERLLIELKKRLKAGEGFWSGLPHLLCDTQDRPQRNILQQDGCWNGENTGKYAGKVVEDGLAMQINNPEVPVQIDLGHTMLNEQKFKLTNLASVLRSAYRGQDIEWWDAVEEVVQGDQEGSGQDYYGEYSDDEDGYYAGSGAGLESSADQEEEEDSEIIVPAWTRDRVETERVDEKWNPWPKFPASSTARPPATTREPAVAGGASSVQHLRSGWTLAKAVATYALPVVTCYFGGFLAETPFQ